MKISSYNVTDVSYHYVGLRALEEISAHTGRQHQVDAISRGVRKLVNERALRLMLPEPRGTFDTIGKKVCQELVHLQLAHSARMGYELTEHGLRALSLLRGRKYGELRRLMIVAHLQAYDNLRAVLKRHLEIGFIWRPIVESSRLRQKGYLVDLLEPIFEEHSRAEAKKIESLYEIRSPKKVESILHGRMLSHIFQGQKFNVPLFRSMCDRMVSLRLLNVQRTLRNSAEFLRSYSPCATECPGRDWYVRLGIGLDGDLLEVYVCDPDMADETHQAMLLLELDRAFDVMAPEGGYYDLPEARDLVCERLMIPEAAFDEGIIRLLDKSSPLVSVGLQYDRISARRKPLIRRRQIHNLIRRV